MVTCITRDGSQVEDVSGDEVDDAWTKRWCRMADELNIPDITDDEVEAIVAELKARSVLIVLDSAIQEPQRVLWTSGPVPVPQDTRTELYRSSGISRQRPGRPGHQHATSS
ncbi:MAG: hypothetical protein U0231_01205 [Nitrospiraceae bacterium]